MNSATLVASLIMAGLLALLIAFIIQLMMRGWRERARRQAELIGTLPRSRARSALRRSPPPASMSAAPWLRLEPADHRQRPGLPQQGGADSPPRRHPGAARPGAADLDSEESISGIRTEHVIAGKVAARDGILAIRWRLPSGVKIDTGFRADNRDEYKGWLQSWPEGVAL